MLIFLILFALQWNCIHKVCQKNYILLLKLLNLHLTFLIYHLFHHLTDLTFFLFHFLFHLFLILSIVLFFFISFNVFFQPFISSLNSSIITYFLEGVKGKNFFGIFEKLTVCFGLVPKSFYLFLGDSAESYSAESSVPKG